ncbi:bifunctional ADP-dependent NAD(P)H-hydrate dehydratase/NAD(P)H-hydrate epimerase [Nocardioides marmorisolisilvae]|uniref:Bifunctional NAD(P)H-hydrate repair enzyme n=1 Tax=Nocardioides marmorisolisilvae TaxID=1542737 RepID=A0A3N0DZE3_9ACTN|nr:bifunctional ADP-dependent NAD(P)H-hydrate dehydratase/NAD(P)H-hydrate epimerase [Nocardioides marmorisolisilvae]RNL80967.1 bifunctional ADP-dependent NAD(P)H-hydrate dehydratase/NAD(P)H-hydrate epimerase [Nocardioides marmorisolisilvae]
MRAAHTVEQVRAAEEVELARLPEGALMQRAATGLAVAIADLLGGVYGRRVLLLVGSGDNGGDALYAGAQLARRGAAVEAILLSEQVHAAGLAALLARHGRVVDTTTATRPDVVVDGIVGIGGRPGLRPNAVEALGLFRDVPVVAVDVPSGVGVDTGELDGPHVVADLTVTFGTHKPCHLVDPAASACGVVDLVGLDLDLPEPPIQALQAADVAVLVPRPDPFAQKYTRGVVGVRAGSPEYTGAAVLTTSGASCGLAGMVRYDGPAADEVRARHPGIVASVGRVQAWVVGPGGGDDVDVLLAACLADGVPVVADAAALPHVEPGHSRLVLTPHAGELASMLGTERDAVEADQLGHVRRAAAHFGCTVLLKGRHTLIADPGGRVRVTTSGVPWLAVAGAGDVLAGVIGALLASGLEPFDAASVGSWLHGAAATVAGGGGPVTPEGVADAVATVVSGLTSGLQD